MIKLACMLCLHVLCVHACNYEAYVHIQMSFQWECAIIDVKGNVACPRTGPPHRRGVFKGLVWCPMGAANTAHLLLQFYFHIISISKSCLAALAVALDKRRVGEGMEERQKRRRRKWNVCYIQWYSGIQIHVCLLECLSLVCTVCVGSRSFNQTSNNKLECIQVKWLCL